LKKEKSEPTIPGALFYLSNRSRIQVNVSPIDAREIVSVLPFHRVGGNAHFQITPEMV
jgi:hypothetical protein